MTFFVRPLKYANFHRKYYIKSKTVLTMTDMTQSTELQAFKRQKDGYKVTVVVYDSKRWQVGTPCVFHSR